MSGLSEMLNPSKFIRDQMQTKEFLECLDEMREMQDEISLDESWELLLNNQLMVRSHTPDGDMFENMIILMKCYRETPEEIHTLRGFIEWLEGLNEGYIRKSEGSD